MHGLPSPKHPGLRRVRAILSQPPRAPVPFRLALPSHLLHRQGIEAEAPRCGPWAEPEPSPRVWERGSTKKGTSVRGLAVSSRQECEEEGGRAGSHHRGRGSCLGPRRPGSCSAPGGKAAPSLSVPHITLRVAGLRPHLVPCPAHAAQPRSAALLVIFDATGTTLTAMESPQTLCDGESDGSGS